MSKIEAIEDVLKKHPGADLSSEGHRTRIALQIIESAYQGEEKGDSGLKDVEELHKDVMEISSKIAGALGKSTDLQYELYRAKENK